MVPNQFNQYGGMPQMPQEEPSFVSKALDWIMTPFNWVKTGFVALVASFAASKSDAVKDGIDKVFSPFTDTAVGTKMAGFGDKALSALGLGGGNVSPSDVLTTEKFGDKVVLKTDKSLEEDVSGEKYQQMRDVKKATKGTYAASLTYIEGDQSRYEIQQIQNQIFEKGKKVEANNKGVDSYLAEYGHLVENGDVPKPVKFKLDVPELTAELANVGKSISGFELMSPIGKIQALRKELIKVTEDEPSFKAGHLRDGAALNLFDRAGDVVFNLPFGISDKIARQKKESLDKGVADSSVPDESIEFIRQRNIKEAIKNGNYDDAIKMAREAASYFKGVHGALDGDEKKEGKQYAKAEEHFNELAKYAINLRRKEELGAIIDKVNGSILDAVEHAPQALPAYREAVKQLKIESGIEERNIERGVGGSAPAAAPASETHNHKPTGVSQSSVQQSVAGGEANKGDRVTTVVDREIASAASGNPLDKLPASGSNAGDKRESTAMKKAQAQVGSAGIPNNVTVTDEKGTVAQSITYIPVSAGSGNEKTAAAVPPR